MSYLESVNNKTLTTNSCKAYIKTTPVHINCHVKPLLYREGEVECEKFFFPDTPAAVHPFIRDHRVLIGTVEPSFEVQGNVRPTHQIHGKPVRNKRWWSNAAKLTKYRLHDI